MRVWRGEEARTRGLAEGVVLALGFFDGVHRGHRVLVRRAVADAVRLGVPAGVLSFEPHPLAVLRPERPVELLNTAPEKEERLASLGVEVAVFYPFSLDVASLSPEAFVEQVLVGQLRVREVVVGYNFSFGAGGAGHYGLLRREGEEAGFRTVMIPPFRLGGEVVSSTSVRGKLLAGEVEAATRFLGYEYPFTGRVVEGESRGRGLGFPTANLEGAPEKLLPGDGVYLVAVDVPGDRGETEHPGMAAVGRALTFNGQARKLEVHLPGFTGDLYGQELRVRFLKRLRGMQRFDSASSLREQMQRDLSRVEALWRERCGARLQS